MFQTHLVAQTQDIITTIVSEILEDQQNRSDIPLNGEELFNDLYTLSNTPIELNSAQKETLEQIPFLSDIQIENILYYVYASGPMLSLYELKAIPELNEKTIRWLLPFITISGSNIEKHAKKLYVRHEVLMRYAQSTEMAKGFRNGNENTYLGDKNAVLFKVDGFISKGISYHFLAEKDRGEQSYTDFKGGSFQYQGKGVLKKIILGDFKIRTGQGILSWSGNIIGKSMDPDLVRRKGEVLSMYKSSMEYGFYRGGAVHLQKDAMKLTLWGSKLAADALVDSTSNGNIIRSINTSGYHNTPTTLSKKNNIHLVSAGTNLQINTKWIKPGFTYMYKQLSLPFQPNKDLSYTHIGKTNAWHQYSMDVFSSIKNVHLWGEAALQSDGNFAGIFGTTLYPADALKATLLYRNYAPGFYSFFGHAFGETGSPRNEKGLFLGLKLNPIPKLTVSTSFDIYTFPWVKYQQKFISEGFESFARINYSINRNTAFYVQLRYEKREKTVSETGLPLKAIRNEERSGIRAHFKAFLGDGLEINSRIEMSFHQLNAFSSGVLLLQDVTYKPPQSKLSGNLRFAWFNTDNYDARIYAYEKDVLYAFSVPPHYGKGVRYYLNLKYRPLKRLEFWLRFARLQYFDRDKIGSGLTEINSSHKTDMKLQMRLKF